MPAKRDRFAFSCNVLTFDDPYSYSSLYNELGSSQPAPSSQSWKAFSWYP